MKKSVQYKTASVIIDNRNILIDIKDAKEMENTFLCPCCGGEMIRRYGETNAPHFAHKRKKCDYSKYLHTLAELKIQKWIRESNKIDLYLPYKKACSNSVECPFYKRESCSSDDKHIFNLKDFYAECDRETCYQYGDKIFIPDLLLHPKDKKNKPLFIEIFVTHPCKSEKIDSGIKIIEFHIKTEEDIDMIIGSAIQNSTLVNLYNFRAQKDEVGKKLHPVELLQKFVLFPSNKTFTDYYTLCRAEPSLMNDIKSFKLRRGIFELTIRKDTDISLQIYNEGGFEIVGRAYASQYFQSFKHCSLCKNQTFFEGTKDLICKLRLERGYRVLTCNASQCPDFQKADDIINRRIGIINSFIHEADIWINNKKNQETDI